MAGLGAFLPVEQGVACWAALKARVDAVKAAGDPRTRSQIAADTLVERLTGHESAGDVDVEVNILVPVENLLDPKSQKPAEMPGFGSIPAGLADEIIGRTGGRRWWRRLFTAPARDRDCAIIVGGDPRARRFTGWLATLIGLRDRCCREPYCTAPIRHIDHIVPLREGGQTSFHNGRGVCEHHNDLREMPRYQITRVSEPGQRHTTITTTPTGHHYLSRAPDPP